MDNIETGLTKYEFSKSVALSLPKMTASEIEKSVKQLASFLDNNEYKNLMFLCKELSYYTIFSHQSITTNIGVAQEIIKFARKDSFLKTLGSLVYVDFNEDCGYMEFWIGEYHFGLFPCDSFIVPV